jgi:hypothetical protein
VKKIGLTLQQQRDIYRDGFVVLSNIIPQEMVNAARREINMNLGDVRAGAMGAENLSDIKTATKTLERVGSDKVILDLFNNTDVKKTVEAFFGRRIKPAAVAQLAIPFPQKPGENVNESGYHDKDTPFYGWCGHLDGLWNGGDRIPEIGKELTPHRRHKWYSDPSRNGCYRTYDQNCNVHNFTALVGIALSDQTIEGCGNLGLLKGAHHRIGEFFQQQRDAGGPLGPDGPGWKREHTEAPNGHGLRHYPEQVRAAFRKDALQTTDGRYWPKPTLVKVRAGDALIVHFATPHSVTRVQGPDPRFMVYFRASAPRKEAHLQVYPDALCDIWLEWRGMQNFVKEHDAKERRRKEFAIS